MELNDFLSCQTIQNITTFKKRKNTFEIPLTKKALNGIMVLEGEGDLEEILKNKLKRFSRKMKINV